jgi:hypothetical protein
MKFDRTQAVAILLACVLSAGCSQAGKGKVASTLPGVQRGSGIIRSQSGLVVGITTPDGHVIPYQYDKFGKLIPPSKPAPPPRWK